MQTLNNQSPQVQIKPPMEDADSETDLNLSSLICFCCCKKHGEYKVNQFFRRKAEKVNKM